MAEWLLANAVTIAATGVDLDVLAAGVLRTGADGASLLNAAHKKAVPVGVANVCAAPSFFDQSGGFLEIVGRHTW